MSTIEKIKRKIKKNIGFSSNDYHKWLLATAGGGVALSLLPSIIMYAKTKKVRDKFINAAASDKAIPVSELDSYIESMDNDLPKDVRVKYNPRIKNNGFYDSRSHKVTLGDFKAINKNQPDKPVIPEGLLLHELGHAKDRANLGFKGRVLRSLSMISPLSVVDPKESTAYKQEVRAWENANRLDTDMARGALETYENALRFTPLTLLGLAGGAYLGDKLYHKYK